MDEPIWAPTVFTKNRDRLLNQESAQLLPSGRRAGPGPHVGEDFTVDGTLTEAWASQKSFQRNDGNTDGDGSDSRGQQRKNDTHASKTDPDARLCRKSNGAESRLAYLGHLLIENRHGLIADAMATAADGTAGTRGGELDGAQAMAARAVAPPHPGRRQAYDTFDFVDLTRELNTTPHVTQNLTRSGGSGIDGPS